MSSRQTILDQIRNNKPSYIERIPDQEKSFVVHENVLEKFLASVVHAGGSAVCINSISDIEGEIINSRSAGRRVVSALSSGEKITDFVNEYSNAEELATIDEYYVPGILGVAEDGAIWVEEKNMINRLLPFICTNLKIVVHAASLVNNLHEAYRRLDVVNSGYGVFIAGPSKTADIEQSLVIGAHGATSLQVFVITGS